MHRVAKTKQEKGFLMSERVTRMRYTTSDGSYTIVLVVIVRPTIVNRMAAQAINWSFAFGDEQVLLN